MDNPEHQILEKMLQAMTVGSHKERTHWLTDAAVNYMRGVVAGTVESSTMRSRLNRDFARSMYKAEGISVESLTAPFAQASEAPHSASLGVDKGNPPASSNAGDSGALEDTKARPVMDAQTPQDKSPAQREVTGKPPSPGLREKIGALM